MTVQRKPRFYFALCLCHNAVNICSYNIKPLCPEAFRLLNSVKGFGKLLYVRKAEIADNGAAGSCDIEQSVCTADRPIVR